jgi:hypothetical protein
MNLNKYDVELGDAIQKMGNYEDIRIWSNNHNNLVSLWGRNKGNIIKIETLMEIPVKPYNGYSENYQSNFFFTITPQQAKEIIEVLQKILKNREKKK